MRLFEEKKYLLGILNFNDRSQNWRSTKLSYAPTKPRRERQINKIDFQSKI